MIYSFPPISDPMAEVLILGTMPGEKSLKLNQYYGHGGNQFWKLAFAIHDTRFSSDYSSKKEILIKNRIALWDVLKVCERTGIADSAINNEESNDFASFFKVHPQIKLIAINGSNAETYFNTYSHIKTNINKITLPSTSPANTWKTFDEKLEQ